MIDVVVKSTALVADGVRSLELAAADGRPLPGFSTGDHIDLVLGPRLVSPDHGDSRDRSSGEQIDHSGGL